MRALFYNCSSLLSLPDISEWDINKVIDIGFMFTSCTLIKFLPNLSKWKTKNIKS